MSRRAPSPLLYLLASAVACGRVGYELEAPVDDVIASLPCLGVSEGAACDDADACTRASICTGGACVATELETCDDDGVACTSESCDPAFGCHRPDDTFCDNGTFCDGAERCDALAGCQAATTFTCDDGVSCSVDSCDEGNDTCVNDPAACFVYGYFVMTSAAYDGNLGGLAGANARCLSDLQGSNWLGKASASLTSANVRAWLCDDTTCQNHTPGVLYKFARAGSATAGGNTLLVDHLGRGPFQHATANPWQGGAYFGVAANYWAGRDQFSQLVDGFAWEDQVFPTEPKGVSCAGWTSNAAGQNGEFATTNPAGCCAERQWDSGGGACSSANLRLLCIVEPTAPQDRAPENFAFASSSNVGPGEVLTQTVVVRGIDTSIPAVVATVDVFDTTQWTAELRNATTASPWSNAAVIRPGDTLEVRTTSSPYLGTTMPVEVSLGSQLFAWNIGTRAPSPEVNNGYMVLSRDLYDGNLGGLAGANARCLDELQRLPWLGVGRVVLDASSVRAMLCDGSTCQGPAPGTKYFFANSGSFTVGGGFFISDGSGAGPGNDSDWAPPFSSYFSYPFFPSVVGWWTGRQAGTATLWPASSHADTCAGWTSTSGVAGNFGDLGAGGSQRWSSASGACGVPRHLMCLVTPGRAPFGFADVEGAAANTLYVRSAVVTGITGTSTASILGTAELRNVTDAGPWGASVSVRSGDTVEARMTSSASGHAAKTAEVRLGDSVTEWFVQTLDPAAGTETLLAPSSGTSYYGDSVDVGEHVAAFGNFFGNDVIVATRSGEAWTEAGRVLGSDRSGTFGQKGAVAVYGDDVVVGDSGNDALAAGAGLVYVFENTGTGWPSAVETRLVPSAPVAGEAQGTGVAIHGNVIATVGGGRNIIVWVNGGSGWANATEHRFTSAGAANGYIYNSVAVVGNTVVAGITGVNQVGELTVIEAQAGNWSSTQQTTITPSLTQINGPFGSTVAINQGQDTIVTGAWQTGDVEPISGKRYPSSGAVYVYEKGATWASAVETIIKPTTPRAAYAFGHSVAIQGNVIAAGAPVAFGGGGAVFMITRTSSWANARQEILLQRDQADRRLDIFGQRVSLCGAWLMTGALLNDASGVDTGAAYLHGVSAYTGGVVCDP